MPRERTVEAGTVIAVDRGAAKIRVIPSRECHGCEHRDRCHEDNAGPVLTWPDASGLGVGDAVAIRTYSGPRVLLALLVYLLPLTALVGGAAMGDSVGGTFGALTGAASGLALGAVAVILVGRIGTRRRWWHASVTRADAPERDHAPIPPTGDAP